MRGPELIRQEVDIYCPPLNWGLLRARETRDMAIAEVLAHHALGRCKKSFALPWMSFTAPAFRPVPSTGHLQPSRTLHA